MITEEKEKNHQNESVTLTINFSKERISILEKARDLMSHTLPNQTWADVMTALAEKRIQLRTEIKRPQKVKKTNPVEKSTEVKKPTHGKKPNEVFEHKNMGIETNFPAARKTIKPNLRKAIFAQDQCCQFKDPLTNKICGSLRFLEIDHIQPVWAGGDNSPDNLRILCSQHNKLNTQKNLGHIRYGGESLDRACFS